MKDGRIFFILIVSVLVVFCGFNFLGRTMDKSRNPLIAKVNADDKSFKGVWVHKGVKILGGPEEEINISVSGKKFNVNDRWIYDGKTLFEIDNSEKQVNWMKWKWSPKRIPFWKMPWRMKPFGEPQKVGEEKMAGRDCIKLRIEGKYGGAKVTLNYWIDKENNVLLKKENIIGPEKDPLLKEFYECERIEYNPSFPKDTFEVKIPANYIKVKKIFPDCELLDNKF